MQCRYSHKLHEVEYEMVVRCYLVDAVAVIRQAEATIQRQEFLYKSLTSDCWSIGQ
jgi:hypothetical protein